MFNLAQLIYGHENAEMQKKKKKKKKGGNLMMSHFSTL